MNKIIIKIKQKFCNHNFKNLDDEICLGLTASWSLKLTKCFQSTYRCSKCGMEKKERYIYFGGLYDDENMLKEYSIYYPQKEK